MNYVHFVYVLVWFVHMCGLSMHICTVYILLFLFVIENFAILNQRSSHVIMFFWAPRKSSSGGTLTIDVFISLSAIILVTCSSHYFLMLTINSLIGWMPEDSQIFSLFHFCSANYFPYFRLTCFQHFYSFQFDLCN